MALACLERLRRQAVRAYRLRCPCLCLWPRHDQRHGRSWHAALVGATVSVKCAAGTSTAASGTTAASGI